MFITAVHKSLQNKHDAAIVWAEDVTYKGFRACVRELKNFDGVHKKVEVVSGDLIYMLSSNRVIFTDRSEAPCIF